MRVKHDFPKRSTKQYLLSTLSVCLLSTGLSACSQDASQEVSGSKLEPSSSASWQSIAIRLNQIGFLPEAQKIALVSGGAKGPFRVLSAGAREVVLSAELSPAETWPMSGDLASIADFSALDAPGDYILELPDSGVSAHFTIAQNPFAAIHDASLKAYYFNRASTALSAELAGNWQRAAGHPDTQVRVHQSAASAQRPEGTILSAPKGWYDAGDYGKYVVNSGISTYTLLLAYAHFPAFYQQHNGRIPESGDALPDILDEVKWNLDWLEAMQDPNDGGVYHKLTTLNFTGSVMPNDTHEQRYVVQKSTAAALNFAAVMALASDIYRQFDSLSPGLSERYKQAAIKAWNWAKANPEQVYQQPQDVSTGAYGDKQLADEFAFAAAQLYTLTNDIAYLAEFKQANQSLSVPSWASTAALGYYALLSFGQDLLDPAYYQQLQEQLFAQAEQMVQQQQASAYRVPMVKEDFVWGSNAVAMNKAMMLLIAYQHKQDERYRNAALALSDYVLGRNPTGYSYVTGFGHKSPMHIHHRPSEADGVVEPVPGFIAGGAQNGWQDKCEYPSDMPAASYVDDYCSYSTNEIAINWNAPLVYVLAALQAK